MRDKAAESERAPRARSGRHHAVRPGIRQQLRGLLRRAARRFPRLADLARRRLNDIRRLVISRSYRSWVRRYDSLTRRDRIVFRKAIDNFATRPLISIVMPVYNTDQVWLERAIDSVRKQIYPNWELCISDDASTAPHVRQVLDRYARKDPRIRVVYRLSNGHISANSNSALDLATGDFVALLDADDELPEHAMFWVAAEIQQHPETDLIYSDEDKIDQNGSRFGPYFKPDWSPALILSQNVFSHLGVYRRSLIESIGRFRVGFEGSQDHDLVLRCSERTTPERIRHIPRVLYHWRAIPGSMAAASPDGPKPKPYAWHAGVRAITEHLERSGRQGVVKLAQNDFYQVHYRTEPPLPKVSIVVPSAFARNLLPRRITSLLTRSSYPNFEILLAVSRKSFSNPAQEKYLSSVGSDTRVRVLPYEDEPFNYSKVNNWAVRQSDAPIVCLLNDDVEITASDWLENLVARVRLQGVAAVGGLLHYPDDRIQHAGVILGLLGAAGHPFIEMPKGSHGYFGRAGLEQDLSCVTAACMALRREAFDAVGGFNEKLAVTFNDVDLCIRLRDAGWRIIWTPTVELYHHESASVGAYDSPQRREQFQSEARLLRELWGDALDRDPFYNPNLSLATCYSSLAFPPRIAKLPRLPA
jgi:GT2 family glycosyltransferase